MKKVKTRVKTGDIMNRDFISINSNASLRQAAKKMVSNGVGSLVIKDGDKLKGLLIEKNIIKAIAENNKDWSRKLKDNKKESN